MSTWAACTSGGCRGFDGDEPDVMAGGDVICGVHCVWLYMLGSCMNALGLHCS